VPEVASVTTHDPIPERPPRLPGFLLGMGLGGFVDGIVLHQLLQWHHILSDTSEHPMNTLSGKEANVLADGVFHAGTWALVLGGMLLMVRAWRRRQLAPPWRTHLGLLLLGWGVFNLVEGAIDHHLLGIHHVRDDLGGPLSWDIGFLIFGLALAVMGALLMRRARPEGRQKSQETA
jgi:uncharacterized membrane protein